MDVVINSHVINSPLFQISIGLLLGKEGTILQGAWLIIFPTSIFQNHERYNPNPVRSSLDYQKLSNQRSN